MRKKSCLIAAGLLSGQLLQPVLAEDNQQSEHQFPPSATTQSQSPQNTVNAAAQQPGQYTPQPAFQPVRPPPYYGYPLNRMYRGAPAYYPPMMQPMMAMPYGNLQNYNNVRRNYPTQQAYPLSQPQSAMTPYPITRQPPQFNPQRTQAPVYRSPYNPNIAATPGPKPKPPPAPKKEVKPWGDTRHIWPDFYTDFTGDFWDEMINSPYKMGYMPGGWRFPSFSSPDPVTVGDAVANQVPPILDESANFINFAN